MEKVLVHSEPGVDLDRAPVADDDDPPAHRDDPEVACRGVIQDVVGALLEQHGL